jgi:hypothetical protein
VTSRKGQNSVLVLATLGVYLGLVFAGAAPQVLASAAMARTFDIQDEIEQRDDLDKKPDEKRSPLTASVQIYLEDVEQFLLSLGNLAQSGRFDLGKDSFDVAQTTMLPCVAANTAGRYTPVRFVSTSEAAMPTLKYLSRGMTYGYSLGDCVANADFRDISAVDSRFDYRLDATELVIKVSVKKRSTQAAFDLLNDLLATLRLYDTPQSSRLRQQVIANTKFHTDNDQVFVVTRFPRAGLRSLLFSDAK